jgi:hypothetical protein
MKKTGFGSDSSGGEYFLCVNARKEADRLLTRLVAVAQVHRQQAPAVSVHHPVRQHLFGQPPGFPDGQMFKNPVGVRAHDTHDRDVHEPFSYQVRQFLSSEPQQSAHPGLNILPSKRKKPDSLSGFCVTPEHTRNDRTGE